MTVHIGRTTGQFPVRCLTDPGDITTATTRLEIDDCRRAAGQLWSLPT
jgi:hypothetical protein